jgi:hypothetical protein
MDESGVHRRWSLPLLGELKVKIRCENRTRKLLGVLDFTKVTGQQLGPMHRELRRALVADMLYINCFVRCRDMDWNKLVDFHPTRG